MTTAPRYLHAIAEADLARKMVFLGGPRQVGKTSLGKKLIPDSGAYLNWDSPPHRAAILKHELPAGPAWFFDEIHKYRLWRGFLKGLFDIHGTSKKILVTGSARLDYYRYGGDCLDEVLEGGGDVNPRDHPRVGEDHLRTHLAQNRSAENDDEWIALHQTGKPVAGEDDKRDGEGKAKDD